MTKWNLINAAEIKQSKSNSPILIKKIPKLNNLNLNCYNLRWSNFNLKKKKKNRIKPKFRPKLSQPPISIKKHQNENIYKIQNSDKITTNSYCCPCIQRYCSRVERTQEGKFTPRVTMKGRQLVPGKFVPVFAMVDRTARFAVGSFLAVPNDCLFVCPADGLLEAVTRRSWNDGLR